MANGIQDLLAYSSATIGYVPFFNSIEKNMKPPMSHEEVNAFMSTSRYAEYVEKKLRTFFYYYDMKGDIKTKMLEGTDRRISEEEIQKAKIEKEQMIRRSDESILLTEGIDALDPARDLSYEEDFCNPCREWKILKGNDEKLEYSCFLLACFPVWTPFYAIKKCNNSNEDSVPRDFTLGKILYKL